jgi:Xaa-Pro aminopeptidase
LSELTTKLALIRASMAAHSLGAVRLRGVDWFAWATCGAAPVVLLTSETGVAEALITPTKALVLTDVIEAERLKDEELDPRWEILATPWQDLGGAERSRLVTEYAEGGVVASDRPSADEVALPATLVASKRRLLLAEIQRYRELGRDAAQAMTEVLSAARPDWSELDLAGRGADALWRRGIHPALTLVAGGQRLGRYRHPTATKAKLGDRAMLVFCARRQGLFANLTRFVYFRMPSVEETLRHAAAAEVEAAALAASRPGTSLAAVLGAVKDAYHAAGYPDELSRHHQGGTTGYLAREVIATADGKTEIGGATALAWNPSIRDTKIEDTVLATEASDEVEILTVDPRWPTEHVGGRARPLPLVRP